MRCSVGQPTWVNPRGIHQIFLGNDIFWRFRCNGTILILTLVLFVSRYTPPTPARAHPPVRALPPVHTHPPAGMGRPLPTRTARRLGATPRRRVAGTRGTRRASTSPVLAGSRGSSPELIQTHAWSDRTTARKSPSQSTCLSHTNIPQSIPPISPTQVFHPSLPHKYPLFTC
jgi:hypothetical protein